MATLGELAKRLRGFYRGEDVTEAADRLEEIDAAFYAWKDHQQGQFMCRKCDALRRAIEAGNAGRQSLQRRGVAQRHRNAARFLRRDAEWTKMTHCIMALERIATLAGRKVP